MKTLSTLLSVASICTLVACGGSELEGKPSAQVTPAPPPAAQQAAPATVEMPSLPEGQALKVDGESSKIEFIGAKVTKSHPGGFERFEGALVVADGAPVGTHFSIDLSSIFSDVEKLTKHLKSDDFFDVARFTKAEFASADIKSVGESNYTVSGILDLHGVRKQISFPATIHVGDSVVHSTAEFKLNRKDFGIVYPGKAEDLIKDDVLIQLDLSFPVK